MANKKKEEKIKIKYLYPESYSYYEKNIYFSDGCLFLKGAPAECCFEKLDVYFKLLFYYESQKGESVSLGEVNEHSGGKKEDKGNFKNYLASSGLGDIFGYVRPILYMENQEILFSNTYVCIILAGLYLFDREENSKNGKELNNIEWGILNYITDRFNAGQEEIDEVMQYIFKRVILYKTINTNKNNRYYWAIEKNFNRNVYSEEQKKQIRELIMSKTKQFIELENEMHKNFEELLKDRDKWCDIQNGKIDKILPELSNESNNIRKNCAMTKDILQEIEDTLGTEESGFTRYIDRREEMEEFDKLIEKLGINIQDLEQKRQLMWRKIERKEEYENVKFRRPVGKRIVPEAKTIMLPPYLTPFFGVLAKKYRLLPMLPQNNIFGTVKLKYMEDFLFDEDLYEIFWQMRRYLDYKYEIKKVGGSSDFLEKYYKFISKIVDWHELHYLEHEKLPEGIGGIKDWRGYSTIYLIEQIFALDLFRTETELILKHWPEDVKATKSTLKRLKWCLKKIYNSYGVFSRKKIAKQVILDFFNLINASDKEWQEYKEKFKRMKKTLKLNEKYELNNVMEGGGISIFQLREKIETELATDNKIIDFYSKRLKMEKLLGETSASSEWVKEVIPKKDNERKLQKFIIIASETSTWTGKLKDY